MLLTIPSHLEYVDVHKHDGPFNYKTCHILLEKGKCFDRKKCKNNFHKMCACNCKEGSYKGAAIFLCRYNCYFTFFPSVVVNRKLMQEQLALAKQRESHLKMWLCVSAQSQFFASHFWHTTRVMTILNIKLVRAILKIGRKQWKFVVTERSCPGLGQWCTKMNKKLTQSGQNCCFSWFIMQICNVLVSVDIWKSCIWTADWNEIWRVWSSQFF